MIGVYTIHNPVSGHWYTGHSQNVEKRVEWHIKQGSRHKNPILAAVGAGWELLETTKCATLSEAMELEQQLIAEQFGLPLCCNIALHVDSNMRGTPVSEATRELKRENAKRLWADPEFKERVLAKRRTPEARAANSARVKKQFTDPARRAEMSEIARSRMSSDDARKANSEMMKEVWRRPEFVAKISIARKASWKDPETRKRLMEPRETTPKMAAYYNRGRK